MKIDRAKHLEITIDELNGALSAIELLRSEYFDQKDFQAVLEKAIEWYEAGNLNAYIFFHKAFGVSDRDPTEFYDGLSSFLVNTLLDDSCFELEWTKYNESTGDFEAPADEWDEDLIVSVSAIWSHDDSPNYSIDPRLMLKAMKYLDDKDRRREELDRKIFGSEDKDED